MKDNTPFLISGRERPNSPGSVSPQRYQFLSLRDAEPNLGVPLTNALPASATWVLTTDSNGNRYFATTILSDSTYTTLKNTSGNYVSVFNTVQNLSGRWESSYTTLYTNSGTWLTVASASSLYYKSSGGDLFGSMNIFGNVLIYGSLSALSGLEFITTKATTTSSLSIVNIGIGPALYVEQDGFYDIARFVDKEGGIVLNVGNVTPPAPDTVGGVVGIRTDKPNHTLTVVGTFSASSDIYTSGIIVSAGVPLDTIIFNANNATLNSVYSTVSSNSAKWESSYAYLKGISGGLVTFQSLSTTPVVLSAANILGNVNIFGNLFAAGSAYFANTIITTTSALSVINSGPGPALFVSQGRGAGDIASFYDGDNSKEVFHVGNATDTFGNDVDGVIGIKTGEPNKTLTVVGEISSTGAINDLLVNYTQGNVVLGKNTTITSFGFDNVFIGRNVATNNTFGFNNTYIGAAAGRDNSQGSANTFIGNAAGQFITLGNNNIAVGIQSNYNLQTGNNNVAIGPLALYDETIGNYNIALGTEAGRGLVTGNYNIFIGTQNYISDNSRTLVIGNNAQASKDFQAIIGDPTYPFVEGIYYGNMSFYGALSANETRTPFLSVLNVATLRQVTVQTNLNVLSTVVISGSLSGASGTLRVLGNQTITNGLSVTALSADFITAYKPITAYGGVVGVRYQYNSQTFNSNGTDTSFSLISAVYSVNEILVFVSGVYQNKTSYFLTNNLTLTMTEAVPAGTGILEVVYLNYSPLPIQQTYITVDDGSIGSAKLASNSVITTKVVDANITPAKLSTGAPTWDTSSNLTVAGNVNANHIYPRANNTYDLGSTVLRWRNIYTQDLHLNNAVGDYTIVEGEDNLYIINNKKKKSYKFALIEVDPAEVPKVSETD